MKSGRPIIWLAALACSACQPGTSTSVNTPEFTATAELNNVLHPNWGDIVRGRLIITGTSKKLLSADLTCFHLQIGDHTSEAPWVDSLIDVLRNDYSANGGTVRVDVYWPVKDFKYGTDADLAGAKLEYKPRESGSCFKFAGG